MPGCEHNFSPRNNRQRLKASAMKKRILIVDGDRHLNKVNEKVISSSGIVEDLRIAMNGREALEYLRKCLDKGQALPHIIVFDLQLPAMDGFQFIDQLQTLGIPGNENIELVVFTASSNPRDKQKATSRGIRHYVNKPYLLRSLSAIVMQSGRRNSQT
jgi:CheY-like chemotaxis protein